MLDYKKMNIEQLLSIEIIPSATKYNLYKLQLLLQILAVNYTTSTSKDLSFPASEIKRAVKQKNNYIKLELRCGGLCGVDSPLPLYFVEKLAKENDNSACLRDFLDIFNSRYYSLMFEVWRKNKVFVDLILNEGSYIYFLNLLSGLNLEKLENKRLYSYAPHFGKYAKTKNNLTKILVTMIQGAIINIEENKRGWQKLLINGTLGKGLILSDNVVLGHNFYTDKEDIVVNICFMQYMGALSFWLDKGKFSKIVKTIKTYLEYIVLFKIVLIYTLDGDDFAKLGSSNLILGFNTVLTNSKISITNRILLY